MAKNKDLKLAPVQVLETCQYMPISNWSLSLYSNANFLCFWPRPIQLINIVVGYLCISNK